MIGFPRRGAADCSESFWLLTSSDVDTIALGMLLILALPTEARIHATACQIWRRFGGVEDTFVRPEPKEWR